MARMSAHLNHMKSRTITAKSSTQSNSICYSKIQRRPIRTKLLNYSLGQIICAAALLLSNRFCFAADCPSNNKVTFGTEETLAHAYQPPDGDILHRYRFVPPGTPPPSGKYPTVLMLPPDIFKLDQGDTGVATEQQASWDLQQAGFLVFQVDHRLAPMGALIGQAPYPSGQAPTQTDDLKRQIMAALADSQCNGSIYLVGGSAGGTLVLWVMLDTTGGLNLAWNETVRSHIKAVVSLSGPTKFCDWNNFGGLPCNQLVDFENDLDNYMALPPSGDPTCTQTQGDCSALDPASPAWLVTNGATSNPPPVRLYTTDGDTVPWAQAQDMFNALKGRFPALDAIFYVMHYGITDRNRHAYTYWHSENNADNNTDGHECVKQEVIEFLQAHP